MDALDEHLEWIRDATPRDRTRLLEHFTAQCDPLVPSLLRPVRPGPVPDGEWERSPEHAALVRMLNRCWPSERSQCQ